jgi:ABC-2 type transport system permease protein
MIRLIQIEWFKLRHYRPFWLLIGMYALLATVLCSSLMLFMEWLKSKGADFNGFSPTMLPLYDFPDIWQNLTFIASFVKVLLGMIVVMSIYNEIEHRILRQNIIDGLSKWEWLSSKIIFIAAIAASATLFLFLTGLITGLIYSHPDAYNLVLHKTQFVWAYFLDVFTFMTFAMMITLLVRKGGLVIVGLLMYSVLFEPIASIVLYNEDQFLPNWMHVLPDFFPIQSLRNLIPFPFSRYIFMEVQEFVSWRALSIVLAWLAFNLSMTYLLIHKRDI